MQFQSLGPGMTKGPHKIFQRILKRIYLALMHRNSCQNKVILMLIFYGSGVIQIQNIHKQKKRQPGENHVSADC